MMRFLFFASIAFLLMRAASADAQTITSKASGGNWNDAATWIGGIVPGPTNDAVIDGIVSVDANLQCRNLTVLTTGIIQNLAVYGYTITATGNVDNNGTVRLNPYPHWANYFGVSVQGSITSTGYWLPAQTTLVGSSIHGLTLTPGKLLEGAFGCSDTLATVTAKTDLLFTSGFDLNKSTLDMQGHSLTLNGAGNISNGRVTNTNELRITGNAHLSDITYAGATILKGLAHIKGGVVFEGTLTIADTLQNQTSYGWWLTVKGNIVNNGLVRLNPYPHWANFLGIVATGNIQNNGVWAPGQTTFSGKAIHELSLMPGKRYSGGLDCSDSTSAVKAKTNLLFDGGFDLKKSTLDMQSLSLTIDASGNISNGTVLNTGELRITGGAHLENITYAGNTILRGIVHIKEGVFFEGSLTIEDTLQNQASYGRTLTVRGTAVNHGLLRENPIVHWANYLGVSVTGGIINTGTWKPTETFLSGSGTRTIHANSLEGPIRATGKQVIFTGNNLLPNLSIDKTARCIVQSGATLRVMTGSVDGEAENWGEMRTLYKIAATQTYKFYHGSASIVAGAGIDSITVSSYGHQVPASFANAVRCWWRMNHAPAAASTTIGSLVLEYDDSELGSNNEAQLEVFYSADSGKTWSQLSTSLNITRNPSANTVALADVPSQADFLLSSSADPVTVRPSVITAVIGSSNIRVGAPTRLTVQYVNNSDLALDDFLLAVNTGRNVHIKKLEIPMENGGTEVLTSDSLFYESEDTTVALYALHMAPHEERTFDLLVYGTDTRSAGSLKKAAFIDPVSITAAAVVTWVAWKAGTFVVCKAINYVGDKAVTGIQMTPEEQKRYDDMVKGGIPTELEKRPGGAKTFALKTVGLKITDKVLELAPAGSSAVKITGTIAENVKKVSPTLRQRIFNWFYKETGLYGVEETQSGTSYQPTVSNATQKKGQLVRSWDPNEKVGPEGFGTEKFITSAGRMMYKILFENKKEATAPAYRIAIVDTIRPEFDPETFEFGSTSHEGTQYQWKKTRDSAVVKWEIEGIELPPNANPPEGEGWVLCSVSPRPGLPSGTVLQNTATITFDMNPPIRTNTYGNILDYAAPTTTMTSAKIDSAGKSIIVRWRSSDGMQSSGVESVTLYVSIDNKGYASIQTTDADSIVFNPDAGLHQYSFYALAKDYVGNVESARPVPVVINAEILAVPLEASVPVGFALQQNFPNPFNPSTTIRYSVASTSRVSLKIFNILGQEVEHLVHTEQSAGWHEAVWNARVASGLYFYRIEAVSSSDAARRFVDIKKMVLIR